MKRYLSRLKEASIEERIFHYTALLLFPIMIFLGMKAGINGDERFHVRQAEATLDWYASFGKDKSFMIPRKEGGQMEGNTTYYYGGLIDITSGVINRVLGFKTTDLGYHDVRHIVISIFGFLGILYAGLLAAYLMGWEVGILAMILLFATPRYTGHAGFNPKDLPFAVGYLMSIYYLIRFVSEMPKVKRGSMIGLAVSIAIAINVRVGGILLIAYLFMFVAITLFLRKKKLGKKFKWKNYNKAIKSSVIVAAGGYLGGMLLWPFGLMNPLKNPFEALSGFTNFHTSMFMSFSGDYITGREVPWNYIPEWIVITTPIIVLVGVILGLYKFVGEFKDWKKSLQTGILIFSILFPIVYVIYKDSVLYDGLRHLLFVLPSIVVLGAVGLGYIYKKYSSKTVKYAMMGLVVLGIINPVTYIFGSPTLSYTFFNPIVGGINGAMDDYTTDYYMLGVKNACKEMAKKKSEFNDDDIIGTDCIYAARIYMKHWMPGTKMEYMSINARNDEAWDYGIFFSRFLHPELITNGAWPLDLTYETIDVRGAPLYCLMKKENDDDFQAMQLLRKNEFQQAIPLLQNAITGQPNNNMLIRELGRAYMQLGNLSEAESTLNEALEVHGRDYIALNYLGLVKLQQGQNSEGRLLFEKSVNENDQNYLAYYYLALIDKENKLYNQALQNVQNSLTYNPNFRSAYSLMADIYEASGDSQRAAQIRSQIK